MNKEREITSIVLSNKRILKDLFEYLKEQHSNLPSHVFEVLGEVIDDLEIKTMNNEKYLGLVLDERSDNYTIGYRETTEIKKLKEWKKEMLECSNVVDCKIIKIEDYE